MKTLDPSLSVHREKAVEHILIGELSRQLLRATGQGLEVLRSEHDSFGYDVVLEFGGVMRHVQLKLMRKGGKRASVDIKTALSRKVGGCVLWIVFDEDAWTLGPYGWFGGEPGQPLPDLGSKAVKNTRANAAGDKPVRPELRAIARNRFDWLDTIDEVVEALFGASMASPRMQ